MISQELGEDDDTTAEAEEYRRRIQELHLDEEREKKLLKEVDRLAKMQSSNQEATVIRTYLDTCLDLPWNTMTVDEIRAFDPIGIIFTGGPQSVYAEGSPQVDPEIFRLGIPILGICYGCQLMAQYLGGEVTAAGKDTAREYGKTQTWFDTDCRLFRGLPEQSITWMSHGDYMAKVPDSFRLVAHSDACPTVGICDEARGFYGVQFHPEVNHTEYGQAMLRNFLYEVCGATGDWTMGDFMRKSIEDIRAKVGDGKVLLALSGGVDSSVAAALLAEAVGNQLTCIFVDHGLLRKNEGDEVEAVYAYCNLHSLWKA